MTLFNGKKKSGDQLRTLSEKEIQDKLYGSFRTAAGSVRDAEYSRETMTATLPKAPATEYFKPAAPKTEQPKAPQVHAEKPAVERPAERPRSWQPGKQSAETKPPAPRKPSSFNGAKAAKFFSDLSHKTGSALIVLFREAVALFIQLILALDFRKPKVRLAVYWGMAGLFLTVLLAGIHFLNIQRETAMKKPRRAAIVQPVDETSAAQAQPKKKAQKQTQTDAPLSAAQTEAAPAATDRAVEVNRAGSHVIQVATFAAEADAVKLSSRLKEDSLSSFVKPLTRSSGKVYYCVFIGRFTDAPAAEKKLDEFRQKEVAKSFQDAFVRTI